MPSKFEGEIWENLGGSFDPGTSLAVVSRAPGVFNIFGLAGNSVWHKGWSDAGGWSPSGSGWDNLGGSFDPGTSLAAVSYGTGNFALFGLIGNSVWHKGWSDVDGWSPSQSDWQNLGGAFDSGTSLVAISQRPGAINVFGVSGNQVWHRADSGKVRVRIEVHRVHCGNTEDATGADELYIVGALSDGTTSRGALTSPMSINDNQEKEFNPSQRVIFDAYVKPDALVRGGLKAFDEDFGKDWAKYKDTVNKISELVSQGLKSTKKPKAVVAGEILSYATKAFGLFAPLDKDDELGTKELNVPAQGSSVEEIPWKFQKKGSVLNPGVSTWNYTVVIRVTRS